MGIKLHCPNGHKLNVKSFLAGRRGICPDCGAKFEIPAETVEAAKAEAAAAMPVIKVTPPPGASPVAVVPTAAVATVPTQAVATVRAVTPAPGATIPSSIPTGLPVGLPVTAIQNPSYPSTTLPVGGVPLDGGMMVSAPGMATHPGAYPVVPAAGMLTGAVPDAMYAAPRAMTPGMGDPLADGPQSVWYVRPPSGGQFGPAMGDMMRRWIAEGRVNAESWVWREGMLDWQPAGAVLPMYFSDTAAGPAALGAVSRRPLPLAPRKRNTGNLVALTVAMLLLAVVLIGVFAYIVSTNQ